MSAELFAPASTLAAVHSFIAVALARGLQIAVLDVKDADLSVEQPHPVVIEVERAILGETGPGVIELVLDRLLPGQRIGAAAWFGCAKNLLTEAGMENYEKEPTLFKHTDPNNATALILHADDGMIASTRSERERLVEVLSSRVKVQVSDPLVNVGDTVDFLKRRYQMVEGRVTVFSNGRYLEALLKTVEVLAKRRESPGDASLLEVDASKELGTGQAKLYRESVGRLLYLSHTRPDIQFTTCVLSGYMQSPTADAMKMLQKVVQYLNSTPEIIRDPSRAGGSDGKSVQGVIHLGSNPLIFR